MNWNLNAFKEAKKKHQQAAVAEIAQEQSAVQDFAPTNTTTTTSSKKRKYDEAFAPAQTKKHDHRYVQKICDYDLQHIGDASRMFQCTMLTQP